MIVAREKHVFIIIFWPLKGIDAIHRVKEEMSIYSIEMLLPKS